MTFKMSITPKLPPVPPLDIEAQQHTLDRQAMLAKPKGALGRLEILSVRLGGITGDVNWLPHNPVVIVCAGDHGVAEQNVSVYRRKATKQMVMNVLNGGAAVSIIAAQHNARVLVVDAGVAGILPKHDALVAGKINYGTADFSAGAAMTPGQADKAIQLGLNVATEQIAAGAGILFVGGLGIGSTAAAAAVTAAITGASAEQVTGRGTGITTEQLQHKTQVIDNALAQHLPLDEDTLPKLGGYEIATMVGVIIGAAARRVPVVLDGYPSAAAALVAARIDANAVNYCIAGHRTAEIGHALALQTLGLTPVLELSMRLGEGTGAILALPLIDAAMRTMQTMATLDEAGISLMN